MSTSHSTAVKPGADFRVDVPWRLIEELPADIRSDPEQLEIHLIRAVEIGIKAMAQAGIHLDTDFVRTEFQQFAQGLTAMSEGLEKLMAEELTAEDSKLARRLRDYLAEEGRLGRMVRQLAAELGDPAREGSIPGRIRQILDENFKHADSPFQRALNISDDTSPLKQFVTDQDKKLKDLRNELTERHTALTKSINSCFEKVFDHIGYKSDLKESEDKGTRKGGTFEDQIVEVVNSVAMSKDVAERIGEEMVDDTRAKRGDVLIHVEQEGFDEERIVIEAKSGGYTRDGQDGLLTQLSDAMTYRDAAAAIAVVTKAHAGKRQQTFDRLGNNRILVVVDPGDEDGGFLPLEVAYAILRDTVLARRRKETESGPDLHAAEHTIAQIQNALNVVKGMKGNCTQANKSVDSIRESIVSMESDIRASLRTLRQQLGV
jgi:hypothetical protein